MRDWGNYLDRMHQTINAISLISDVDVQSVTETTLTVRNASRASGSYGIQIAVKPGASLHIDRGRPNYRRICWRAKPTFRK